MAKLDGKWLGNTTDAIVAPSSLSEVDGLVF
jgi:hypothetical protein